MNINQAKFNEVAEAAKAKTNDKRWRAAIDKAVAGIVSGWIVTELAHGIMVTTEAGTYLANGSCQCKAFAHGQPCKHRALARLIDLYNETAPAHRVPGAASMGEYESVPQTFCKPDEPAPVAVSRESLIADIKQSWPATWPPLATELMARFRCNDLNFLADDMLQSVRLAIAM
jgi:hypothetical protein